MSQKMEYVRFLLIDSPLEMPARALRDFQNRRKISKTPVLAECLTEDHAIESVMRKRITNGMNCIDVGAHLGTVLSRFNKLSPAGKHIAFEPLEYKARWLQSRFKQHTIHAKAVSNFVGTVDFFFQPKSSGYSGLKLHDAGINQAEEKVCLKVPTCRLDDVVPSDRVISFIKVDVEGAETQVFDGARELLRRDRPMMIFECARSALKNFDVEPTAVYDMLNNVFGYDIYVPADLDRNLPPLSRDDFNKATEYPFRAFNFFALPR